jgi:hypothetical protein
MITDSDAQYEPGDISKQTVEEKTKPAGLVIKDLGAVSKKTRGALGFNSESGTPPFNSIPA